MNNHQNGDIACDHYHLYRNDINLLKNLGVNAYRFSIAWTRIFPQHDHQVNQLGLAFYDNLVNRLLALRIEPIITLYHWDMPQYLEDQGGFLNRGIVDEFAYYASFIAHHFKGRVKYYVTINEPQCIVELGLRRGEHAPGKHLDLKDSLLAVHHILLCHGAAVKAMREVDQTLKIGIALTSSVVLPINGEDSELVGKARERQFSLQYNDFFGFSLYGDPIYLKDYPREYYEMYKGLHPSITKDDLAIISTPVDICYLNIYSGYYVDLTNRELTALPFPPATKVGSLPWLRFTPEALYYGPRFVYERYGKPIIISENGACIEEHDLDLHIDDADRIEYLATYLDQLQRARGEGIPIQGYFYWSLLDNFEWAEGHGKRFGLVRVDFKTQTRRVKQSYYFYRDYIKKHT